jgi:hypothetical protein
MSAPLQLIPELTGCGKLLPLSVERSEGPAFAIIVEQTRRVGVNQVSGSRPGASRLCLKTSQFRDVFGQVDGFLGSQQWLSATWDRAAES